MSANTTIQIKRSFANSSPDSLKEGELAYSFVSNTLFIGNQSNSAVTIISPNLALQSLSTRYIDLAKLPYTQYPGYLEGRMWYNLNAHSIQFQTDFDSFDAVPGQIEYARAYNNSGAQINKGKPVYITGVKGVNNPVDSRILTIDLADASDVNKKDVFALAGHDIPNLSEGFVIIRGPIYGINTSNLTAGSRFHLGFASPGSTITLAPEYPNYPMDLGQCLVSNTTTGAIYVDIIDHSFERMRVTNNARVGGDLVVDGNFTVLGTQTIASSSALAPQFIYLNSGDSITNPIFTGTGLNDLSFVGHYSGNPSSTSFYVRINSAGGAGVDTFDWSYNSSFSPLQGSNIGITGSVQPLANGIGVQFQSIQGHTAGDAWSGIASSTNLDFGLIGNYNDGTYSHSGLFRDASDGDFKFFNKYNPEISTGVDINDPSFALGNVKVEKITASSFFKGGIDLYNAINSAANTSAVYANGTLRVSNVAINFVNTATIRANISSGSGLANISFDLIGSSGIASFPVLATGGTVVSANGLNFVNTATVGITVSAGISGNANISFTTLAGGGTVTSVNTGIGLTGGSITSFGTISANIASTTVQGVTKLIDVVNSNDSANAATANSVKTAFDQASAAYTQANTGTTIGQAAYGQANLAYAQANTATTAAQASYVQANLAYTQANTGVNTAIAAYNQANLAYTQANTESNVARAAYAQANLAYTQANTGTTAAQAAYGQANLAYTQANTGVNTAIAAYGQANLAYTQANTGTNTAIAAYGQANAAFAAANNAANVRITANSGAAQSAITLNFVNTASIQVSVGAGAAANANISFNVVTATTTVPGIVQLNDTFTSTSTTLAATANSVKATYDFAAVAANQTSVSANSGSLINDASLNFNNTSSILVSITSGILGNANVAFSAVSGSTTVPGILQLTDSVTSTSTTTAATPNSVKTAFDQGNTAYGQANAAYTQANTANSIAIAAYGQANLAYAAANSAANAVRVTANSGPALSNVSLNFVNTATVQVSVTSGATGVANISFTSTATGTGSGINTFPVSANAGATVTANGINFVNSATVTVVVTQGVNGNANVSFASTGTGTPGGSNTQIQFNNNGSFGGSPKFTYNTSPNLVSVDADLKLANTNKLYFGGEQANNSVANSKFSISFNVSATSLDFTFLG